MMKKALFLVLVIFIPLGIAGCSQGMIRADGIDGLVEKVTGRHDKWAKEVKDVNGDGKVDEVDDADRATYLRSSEILRRTVLEARSP